MSDRDTLLDRSMRPCRCRPRGFGGSCESNRWLDRSRYRSVSRSHSPSGTRADSASFVELCRCLPESWLSICTGVAAAAPKLLSAPSEGDVKFGLIAARAEIGVNADVVNWDFIPQSAINQLTLVPSNPVYGLNATGGALAFEMKNGYTYHAIEGELSGGSYGRAVSSVQAGGQTGNLSGYITARRRVIAPARIIDCIGGRCFR